MKTYLPYLSIFLLCALLAIGVGLCDYGAYHKIYIATGNGLAIFSVACGTGFILWRIKPTDL